MEAENFEIEESKIREKCEIFPVLGELNVNAGREITEMKLSEEVIAEGGEDHVLENHVTAESEIMEEVVAVAVAEVDVPHVVGENVLEIIAEQVCEPVDDVNAGKDVTAAGNMQPFSVWRVEAGGDEILVDQRIGEKEEEDVVPVDSEVEPVVADSAETVSCHESQTFGSGKDLEEKMSDGGKFEEQVQAEVDTLTLESDTDLMVAGDANDVEKVDLVVNCLVVETAKKSSDADEEKGSSLISEDTPTVEVKTGMELITEVNPDVVNARENVVHELGDMEYAGVDPRHEFTEGKELTAAENMMSETKMVEVENTSVEDEKDLKLDEHTIVVENRDEAIVHEDLAAGDCTIETVEELDSDMTGNDVADAHIEDAGVKTGVAVDVVADEIAHEDTKFEAKITSRSSGDPCEGIDDSSAAGLDENNGTLMAEEEIITQDTEMETETDMVGSGKAFGGKRKRGKVSKSPLNAKNTGKASSRKTAEEDVCFICFDGGELVLCDRRGCPKAYHPTCVNRDEAFFRSKGRWNCGWHMCSICEKNALFMCYTCTFSLCKKCTKDAVILCVRGNKGFCETCMRTVVLIENNEQGNNDALTSFDDKGSWEFLFKDYYTELKSKLALSSVEIAEAKNPWKGKDMLSGPSKHESSDAEADDIDEGSGSEESIENLKTIKSKRKKKGKKSISHAKGKVMVRPGVVSRGEGLASSANSGWASKELLEFVSHMKNGDTSVLSQFDVQGLLLEYIKRNKLRDPRRKSQIICDARLEVLFAKPRVGHFEMLKLLESHFLIRTEQNDDGEGSIVDTENNQLDMTGSTDHPTKVVKDRKHRARKKGGLRGPQSNLDDYAAIDMHNISLIYLRRKLMEDLLEDVEKFHDKVIGMFVRIRISGSNQKQDLYRLVQVVGTSKAAEPYKIGKKTTDIVLEILNLDKTEVTSIDTISNQDFTEEECKRLRQSIKCGLISRLTVGEILDKATEIQEARVNDWLESETLRLSHLRDRANYCACELLKYAYRQPYAIPVYQQKHGCRASQLIDILWFVFSWNGKGGDHKERECVEKLQVLKTPEERLRKLNEVPEINADPKMDPNYESDENDHEAEDSRRDDFLRSRGPSFSRRERGVISPGSDSSVRGGAGKVSSKDRELSRNLSGNNISGNATHSGEMVNETSWNIEGRKDANDFKYVDNRSSNSEFADRGKRYVTRSESLTGVSSVTSDTSHPVRNTETLTAINETEKMWHYQDPSGKVQGPFSMVQLRKWSNTGYFPTDLKVWKTGDKQEDSILVADALAGKFEKEKLVIDNIFPSADTLHSLPISASHFDRVSGTSLLHLKNRTTVDQSTASHTKLSSEKWVGSDITNLPSPTPKQSNAVWTGGEGGFISADPLPSVERTNIGNLSVADASVLSSIVQTSTTFSPTPNSQGFQVGPANSLSFQSTMTSEPHSMQMHGHQSTMVHQVVSQSPLTETQVIGGSAQSQPVNYWAAPNMQNYVANFSNLNTNAAAQPEYQRPAQSIQPNMYPPPVPDATNIGWGTPHTNPSMTWGNPAPGTTNMYRGPPIQPTVNAKSGWVATTGIAGANIAGPMQAVGPGWVAPPVQASIPGNGWGLPSANPGAPASVQGSAQGNTNQGWGAAPQGNQGLWVGQQNFAGNQFPGHHNDQGRDPGFGGGKPWNRQSSFGGGGPRGSFNRQEMMCPYYSSGRCRKGAQCDFRHN
ncbi:zinc finger CCCH domain-containing protein 19 [Dorcoceras hygrometricum]|uniref:Zinc finger CCCH domain-containing protein 19 n=1 Tax=Dorcoceras hygrometricum TaxID=472368 RepID=A0A2Z7D1Q1_9LAMI|nr:zinc finger CCCH domain-containing protein 19 [Dorcoceras hygrometricum]